MLKDKYNPEEVCALFDVDNNTLKLWRSPQRLKDGKDNPLYLPVQHAPDNKNVVWYTREDLTAFIQRNDKYRERVYAAYVPEEVRQSLLPRAQAHRTASALRADAPHTSLQPEPTQPAHPWATIGATL